MRHAPSNRSRSGQDARGGVCPGSGGFTLLEVMIALALLGLMTGLAVRGIRSMAKSDLRGASAKLSGAMRYLFDRASTTGKIHRLVVDLDEGKYWAEVTDDRFYLPRERETEEAREAEMERLQEEIERRQSGELSEEEQQEAEGDLGFGFGASSQDPSAYNPEAYLPKPQEKKRATFSAFKETIIRPVTLKRTKVSGLFTPRLAEPIQNGRGYVYFFPLGFAEPAVIHMADEDEENVYSLVVHPLTGRVKIYSEYVEPPVEEQFDDEGNVIEP